MQSLACAFFIENVDEIARFVVGALDVAADMGLYNYNTQWEEPDFSKK